METDLFHFLRPEWFWALIPACLLFWLALRSRNSTTGGNWGKYVDAHLLRHLAAGGATARASRLLPALAAAMLLILVTALAGPTWQKTEVPSYTGGEPVVAVLSLAQSMNSDDLSPSRMRRAVHKLRDILARTEGEERALVIYSDIPFVAAPLTSDRKVISQMLPELSTKLMPVLGNRPDLAISEAVSVLKRADAGRGEIVLIADNAGDIAATEKAAIDARKAGYTVSVLGIGTEKGATLQTARGQAITSRTGEKVTTALDAEGLDTVARAGGGAYSGVTASSADLNRILPKSDRIETVGKAEDFQTDSWVDMGYWLLILPVLLLPFAFRRGLVFSIGLVACLTFAPGIATRPAHAGTWQDLWSTPDQQGQKAFASGDYDTASRQFETPSWRGSAAYRAGDYASAAQEFAIGAYNRGNALAKSGQLEEALGAYDQALAANPQDADAKYNRDLIQKLLDEQKQQQEQEQENNQQQQAGSSGEKDQQQQSGNNEKQNQQQFQGQSGQQPGSKGQQDQQNAGGQSTQQQQASDVSQQQEGDQSGLSGQSGKSGDQQQSAAQPGQDSGSAEDADQQSASQGGQPEDQASDNAKNGQSTNVGEEERSAAQAEDKAAGAGDEKTQGASETRPQGQEEGSKQAGQQEKVGSEGLAQEDQAAQEAVRPPKQASASGNAGGKADKESENRLSKLLSSVLDGNGEDASGEPVEASIPGAPVVGQAIEQQLRKVPDDPSGLLRARIRQHYVQLRSGAN
ncbi:tetratricopeptide repeat protein [Roseibium algae]|uniref:Tetratricopeptide repeat protein n=1 Tax=Roseibium algae TaxID=3123038 RepID=A0ABU8TLM7_9HYPH